MGSDQATRRQALKTLGAVGLTGVGAVGMPAAAQQESQPPAWLQAREAAIRIDTLGTYDFPEFGGLDLEGEFSGSGFLIDPSGIAVTANHVVTGAAALEVFVGEDTQESYNAQVLGASECSDLAVIQLQGSDFPSLDFAQQPVSAGTAVYAHGFPVNSDRLSTTNGIVSRTDVNGESNWASVDSVLEHTARINFGSSGGPLVDERGNVVGVNYAGYLEFDQNLAIGTPVANPIISTLSQGQNVEYVGINGVAIETAVPLTPDGINRAIHVISVESGSPAYQAGIRAGDRVVRIENTRAVRPSDEEALPTKAFYCDVLRTRGSDSVISVQVLRQAPGQVTGGVLLEGTINGDPLQVVPDAGGDGGAPESFTQVTDDTGTISVDVPANWSDAQTAATEIGPQLIAAPDVNGYLNTWDVPGVYVLVSDQLGADPESVLDDFSFGTACGSSIRSDFSSNQLTGRSERFEACGESGGASTVNVAALPPDESYTVYVNVALVSEGDEAALNRIVQTLSVQNFTANGGGTETGTPEQTQTPTPTETPQSETPGSGTDGTETDTPEDGSQESLAALIGAHVETR